MAANKTDIDNNDVIVDEIAQRLAKTNVVDEWLVEAPLQTSTPVAVPSSNASILSSTSTTTTSILSVSQIMRRVTNDDGSLDYDKLKVIDETISPNICVL